MFNLHCKPVRPFVYVEHSGHNLTQVVYLSLYIYLVIQRMHRSGAWDGGRPRTEVAVTPLHWAPCRICLNFAFLCLEGAYKEWMGASWATKCAHQIDQSDLASLAPKVRVIQYPMNCHPKLIKVVLCSSRLRHNAWTTSASSALSTGSVEILWVVFLKHCFLQKMSI